MTVATGTSPNSATPMARSAGRPAPLGNNPPPRPRTDRRLRRTRTVLAIGSLVFGLAGITSAQIRADGADDVKSHSGVLIQQAEQLYHSLSDADATAATIYLHVGEAPKGLQAQYDKDLQDAQALLLAATNEAGDDHAAKDALTQIARQLPIYAKLNATAAANNLIGFPVGIRYLNQASNLMQGGTGDKANDAVAILPQAKTLTDIEARNLAAAEDTASQFPWLMVAAGAVLLIALLVVQSRESRRTNRVFSLGLVGATAALVLSLLWTAGAVLVQNNHVDHAKKRGSDQISVLATASILSLQARTDEMLTLVGRGTADDKEADYAGSDNADGSRTPGTEEQLAVVLNQAHTKATDTPGSNLAAAASDDETAWHRRHLELRDMDQQNQYQKAVDSALGEHDFAGKPSADQAFTQLQNHLNQAIEHAEASFRDEASAGADALTGLEVGLGVLALAMAAAVVVGLGRRLAEYH